MILVWKACIPSPWPIWKDLFGKRWSPPTPWVKRQFTTWKYTVRHPIHSPHPDGGALQGQCSASHIAEDLRIQQTHISRRNPCSADEVFQEKHLMGSLRIGLGTRSGSAHVVWLWKEHCNHRSIYKRWTIWSCVFTSRPLPTEIHPGRTVIILMVHKGPGIHQRCHARGFLRHGRGAHPWVCEVENDLQQKGHPPRRTNIYMRNIQFSTVKLWRHPLSIDI